MDCVEEGKEIHILQKTIQQIATISRREGIKRRNFLIEFVLIENCKPYSLIMFHGCDSHLYEIDEIKNILWVNKDVN